MSRKSSAATKVSKSSGGRRKDSGSHEGRSLSRTRGRSPSVESSVQSRASSRAFQENVADGALDDSSDTDEDESAFRALGITNSGYSSRMGHSSKSSISSNLLDIPNEVDEFPRRFRTAGSTSRSYFSDDAGELGDDNYNTSSSSETGRESPRVAAPPSSPVASTQPLLDRPKISKQDSRSSIKTAVPSSSYRRREPTARESADDTEGKTNNHLGFTSSTDGELGGSTRRPSPAGSGTDRPGNLRRESFAVSVKPSEEPIPESPYLKSHRLNSSSTSPHPSAEQTPLLRDGRAVLSGTTDRVTSYGTNPSKLGTGTVEQASDEERGRSVLRGRGSKYATNVDQVIEDERRMQDAAWSALQDAYQYYSDKVRCIAQNALLFADEHPARVTYKCVPLWP